MAKTATSLASVFEVERCDESVVGQDGFIVLAQPGDLAADGVLGHFASFVQGSSIPDAAWQGGEQRPEAAFWFWAQHDVVTVPSGLCHSSGHFMSIIDYSQF